jgi:arylsulfatase A-like enzyme
MKFIRLLILTAALLPSGWTVRADLASLFTNVAPAATAVPRRPSIILIQFHGLGTGDLSCYGQTNFQTPNLDRLAAEGVRCLDYRTGAAENSPATAALLAGKAAAPARGEINLAQRLKQAGYRTGLLGEWSLGGQPWQQGFDEFAGFLDDAEGRNYYADYLWRFAPKSIMDVTNKTLADFAGKEMLYQNTGGQQGRYLPDVLLEAAANFVRVNQPDRFNYFRPFFLLVNVPAPRPATAGQDDFPVPTDAPFTGENWPPAAKNRAALLARLDNGVGRLLEQFNKSGLTNNVALFVTSLAATEKFADTNLAKWFRPDAAGRVPMIVRWPAHVPAGSKNVLPWTAADFAPTALEIALMKPAKEFTGVSVLPALLGQSRTNAPVDFEPPN